MESDSVLSWIVKNWFPFLQKKDTRKWPWICGILLIIFGSFIILILVLISCSVAHDIELFGRDVTVGKTKGYLTVGTMGYCYQVSNNKTCSKPKFFYTVNPIDSESVKIFDQVKNVSFIGAIYFFNIFLVLPGTGVAAISLGFLATYQVRKVPKPLVIAAILFSSFSFLAIFAVFGLSVDFNHKVPNDIHHHISPLIYFTLIPAFALMFYTFIMVKLCSEKNRLAGVEQVRRKNYTWDKPKHDASAYPQSDQSRSTLPSSLPTGMALPVGRQLPSPHEANYWELQLAQTAPPKSLIRPTPPSFLPTALPEVRGPPVGLEHRLLQAVPSESLTFVRRPAFHTQAGGSSSPADPPLLENPTVGHPGLLPGYTDDEIRVYNVMGHLYNLSLPDFVLKFRKEQRERTAELTDLQAQTVQAARDAETGAAAAKAYRDQLGLT